MNTEDQVALTTPEASDEDEARWNFAFWLQEPLDVIDGPDDPNGKDIIDAAFREASLRYDEDDFSDEALAVAQQRTDLFVSECVRAVQRLHSEEVIEAVFGRSIPVLVHELEYYEEIAVQNRVANPASLVDPFVRWIESMYE